MQAEAGAAVRPPCSAESCWAELASGQLRRILFMATGALLSPTTTMQGESIPSIAQAVVLEHIEESRKGGN